jgi:hypothetical protein
MSNIFGGAHHNAKVIMISIIIVVVLIFSFLVLGKVIKLSTFQNKSIMDISHGKNKMMNDDLIKK